jgi:hypothetical protein
VCWAGYAWWWWWRRRAAAVGRGVQSGTHSNSVCCMYHNSSDGGRQRPSIQISVYTGPIARFLVGKGPFGSPYVICHGEARTLQAAGSSRVPRQLWLRCTLHCAAPSSWPGLLCALKAPATILQGPVPLLCSSVRASLCTSTAVFCRRRQGLLPARL